jgi:splicing factor 3B subunit 4
VPPPRSNRDATVYITGLEARVTDALLYELCLQCGPVRSLRLPSGGEGQRFAFCEYGSEMTAAYAVRVLDGTELWGSRLRVELANRRDARNAARGQIFVRPLHDDVDDADLQDLAAVAAPGLVDAEVKRDPANGRCGGGRHV